MISYKPLWETMKKRGVTPRQLTTVYGIYPDTVKRLRNNGKILTKTINKLCASLDCRVEDIIEYIPDQNEIS